MLKRILGAGLAVALAGSVAFAATTTRAQADDDNYQALPYLVGLNGDIDPGDQIGQIADIGGRIADINDHNYRNHYDRGIGNILINGRYDQDDQGEDDDIDADDGYGGVNVDQVIRDTIYRHGDQGYYHESLGDAVIRDVIGNVLTGGRYDGRYDRGSYDRGRYDRYDSRILHSMDRDYEGDQGDDNDDNND